MKQYIKTASILFLICFLLKYPEESLFAARDGMKLWLNTLLPTLLPFLILTGVLLSTDTIAKILYPFSWLWETLFGLSPYGTYAFLLGMLCGYPMGAKLTSDLYCHGKINKREAHYLLTFSNNPSPVFLSSYLSGGCLKGRTSTKEIVCILLLSNLFCMLLFRFGVYHNQTATSGYCLKKETSAASSNEAAIDVSIMNGFETITRLGGYILLFSIFSAVLNHFCTSMGNFKYILLGFTELTTGLHQLTLSDMPYPQLYLHAMTVTAFGGLCILAQTKSILNGKLSILPYLSAKCIHAVFTALLVLVISKVI